MDSCLGWATATGRSSIHGRANDQTNDKTAGDTLPPESYL